MTTFRFSHGVVRQEKVENIKTSAGCR